MGKFLTIAALLCTALLFSSNSLCAHCSPTEDCAPDVACLLKKNKTYKDEYYVLQHIDLPRVERSVARLLFNPTEENYRRVLTEAHRIVIEMNTYNPILYPFVPALSPSNTFYQSPRVVITAADGTVIVDTGKPSGSFGILDPLVDLDAITAVPSLDTNTFSGSAGGNGVTTGISGNSLVNWLNRDVNENHNGRVAISNAQHWLCGLGVETKYSTSVGSHQAYVAERLGELYHNHGTIRLSVNVVSPL